MTITVYLAQHIAESAAVQMQASGYRRPVNYVDDTRERAPITLPLIPPRNPRNYEARA
jgi:hypothetical protein